MCLSQPSPCYQENDPQRFPCDGKQEQSDGRAESDESAAEKHRRRHFGSCWGESTDREAPRLPLLNTNEQIFDLYSPDLHPVEHLHFPVQLLESQCSARRHISRDQKGKTIPFKTLL